MGARAERPGQEVRTRRVPMGTARKFVLPVDLPGRNADRDGQGYAGGKGRHDDASVIAAAMDGHRLAAWDIAINERAMADPPGEVLARMLEGTAAAGDVEPDQQVHPHDRTLIYSALKQHLDGKADTYSCTYRMRRTDGAWGWVNDRGRIVERDEQGRAVRMVGVRADARITDRRMSVVGNAEGQAQPRATLRDEYERLKKALDASGIGVWDWGVESGAVVYSSSFPRLLGYGALEWGQTIDVWLDRIHPDDLKAVKAGLNACLEGERPGGDLIYRLQHKDGRWLWMRTRGVIVKNSTGATARRVIGTTMDVSSVMAVQAGGDTNGRFERLAHTMAHDLREPVRMISGYLQIISRRYGGDLRDEGQEMFGFVLDGAHRMSQMIDSLMDYATLQKPLALEDSFSLDDILADVQANLRLAIRNSGACVTVSGALPCLVCDRQQMVRLFQNLIGNAIKFRVAGTAPEVTISARSDAGCHRILVADNGIGIPVDAATAVFQPLRRLHGVAEYEGSGLGLAICQRIAEHHGGFVSVAGNPGGGSVFTVTLPY